MPRNLGSRLEPRILGWLIVSQLLALAIGLWLGAAIESRFVTPDGAGRSRTYMASVHAISNSVAYFPTAISFGGIACLQVLALWIYERHLRSLTHQAEEQIAAEHSRLNSDVVRLRDAIVFGLAKLAESRDTDTGHHLERIAAYSTRLAEVMQRLSGFQEQISHQFVKDIGVSSALHDIGKVAVEDAVLLKPGPLTDSERQRMQKHPLVGAQCIEQIGHRLGDANFLELAYEIALNHHERWDGTGYPHQLSGTEIPLSARIVALADVYDALSVRRVYKPAIPHKECVEIIQQEAGGQFDPQVVQAFLQIADDFESIRSRFLEANNNTVDQDEPPASSWREHAESRQSPDLDQILLTVLGSKSQPLVEYAESI